MSNGFVTRDVAAGFAAHLPAGRRTDDDVPDGVYWQVSSASGWIAGPAVLLPCVGATTVGLATVGSDRPGNQLGDVTPDRPLTIFVDCPDAEMAGWMRLQTSGDLRLAVIAAESTPSGEVVELAAWADEPHWVAAADLRRVRVTGTGQVWEVAVYTVSRGGVEFGDPLEVASLAPDVIDRLAPVYARSRAGAEDPSDRILAAAPKRALPYSLQQPWPGYQPGDELARVRDLTEGPDGMVDWLVRASIDRWSGTAGSLLSQDVGGGQQLRFPVEAAIALGGSDPGVARWLGRAGVVPPWAQFWHDQEPTLAAVLVPTLAPGWSHPVDFDSSERRYDDALGGGYTEMRERVAQIPRTRRGLSWGTAVQVVPLPFLPQLPPALPRQPRLAPVRQSTWTVDDQSRTDGWERTIALQGCAPTGPVSFVQLAADGSRTSLHAPVADPTAAPLLPATPAPATPGVPPLNDPSLRGRPRAADPAAATSVTWEVQLEDWMGRWGPAATITLDPPAPARPATPTLRATLVRQSVSGNAALSPGLIHLEISVARASGPGVLPLAGVDLECDGAVRTLPVAATGGQVVTFDFVVPPTVPGGGDSHTFQARVADIAAGQSDWTSIVAVRADDARPLPVPTVSPRLVVAGRPGPASEVELQVRVRAPAGAAFCRIYRADESVVRARLGLPAGYQGRPRGVRAAEVLAAGLPPRNGFALTTTVPVAGGWAQASLHLPSAAADLILVRPVFVTGSVDGYGQVAEGVESPVEKVAPAYVIVPSTDLPPLPQVRVTPTEEGKVEVAVRVEGSPAATLSRLAGPLEARVVEAIPGQQPFYWPEVGIVTLVGDGGGVFTGTLRLDVPGWTRISLAAAVRYAAEPVTVPGADIVVDPDLVAVGAQPQLVVSPWGPVGAPVSADVPGPEPVLDFVADGADWQVSVSPLPAARAQPGFTALVYAADADGVLLPAQTVAVDASSDSFAVAGGAVASVVLVDPFGTARDAVPVG